MIGFFVGMIYANAGEWFIHKHILHDMGRKKGSFFSFHYMEHHKNVRKNAFYDEAYHRSLLEWNPQAKEALGLAFLAAAHAPLFPVAPTFTLGVWYSIGDYYYKHKKSHLDPEWAKKHLPWHYDHHMGRNQDANWCVSRPWFDHIMGTRIEYLKQAEQKTAIA